MSGTVEGGPSGAGNGAPPGGEGTPRTRQQEEEYLRAQREGPRRGEALAEFREGRNIDPAEVWITISNEFLFPSEAAGIPVSPYESGPILKECLRRAGASGTVLALQDRANELEVEIRDIRNQFDAQEDIADQGKTNKEKIGRQYSVWSRRLYGIEVPQENGSRVKVEHGLLERLHRKMEEEGTPEDKKEWIDLYWKITGSLTLLDIHKQREGALGSIETYTDQLFVSGFYKHEIGMTEFLSFVRDPLYGPAIEEGLKAYIEIHLGKQDKQVKFGEFGPGSEFDGVLEEYLVGTGKAGVDGVVDRSKPYYLPKPLQIPVSGDIPAREVVTAYVQERVARVGGKYRPYVAERADLVAKRVAEFCQLTTWLSFPRDTNGGVIREDDGNFPKEGCGRLEGKTSTDLAKFYVGKWENERRAGKPAGVKPWKWEMVPFETFSRDVFHEEVVIKTNWYDEAGELVKIPNLPQNAGIKERRVPIFDLWYKGYTSDEFGYRDEKHSLLEIMGGMDLGKRGELRPIRYVKIERDRSGKDVEVSVTVNAVPRERIEALPENFFDGYHFLMYKQGKARELALLQGMPGTKDDCISPLMTPRDLEQMSKDLGTAFGNEIARNLFKVNLVVTRVLDFLDKKGDEKRSEKEGEIGVSRHGYVGDDAKRVGRGIGETHVDYILAQVKGTSFLSEGLVNLCKERIDKRLGMMPVEEFIESMPKIDNLYQDAKRRIYFKNALVDFYRLVRPLLKEYQRVRIDKAVDNL